jgi:hypothetical protein
LHYRTSLFRAATIRALLDDLEYVLRVGAARPGVRLDAISRELDERQTNRHLDQRRLFKERVRRGLAAIHGNARERGDRVAGTRGDPPA